LNKSAANDVNVFYLTWTMSLHYFVKLEVFIGRLDTFTIVTERNAGFDSSWLQRVRSIAREGVQDITDLDELKQRLRTEWAKLSHVVIEAAIRQWRRW